MCGFRAEKSKANPTSRSELWCSILGSDSLEPQSFPRQTWSYFLVNSIWPSCFRAAEEKPLICSQPGLLTLPLPV